MSSVGRSPWLVCLLGVAACGGEAGTQSANTREIFHYRDANPEAPLDDEGRAQLMGALGKLHEAAREGETELSRDLAFFTLERIEAGDVLIGSVPGARGLDRWHMCKDYELAACEGDFPGDEDWIGDESVSELLTDELDGYQWGNRLYFSFRDDTDAASIAATLVHEVNHVLNRSECSYYEDIDAHVLDHTLAYVEEYRAFFTECFYSHGGGADVEACNTHTTDHLVGYEFSPDLTEVLPDGEDDPMVLGELILEASPEDGYGVMVPTESAWPESFEPCSCVGAYRDGGGYCRLENGRFAADACCG